MIMNNEEILNPDFDINAKYEDMIERAKHNIDLYLEAGKDCSDISLSYDVKNYLPNALEEIERLNNIIDELVKYIKFHHEHIGKDEKAYIDIDGILNIIYKEE